MIYSVNIAIDSSLETEIEEKIEGDLKKFLLNFLQNKSLDNNISVDYELVKQDIDELAKLDVIPSDSEIILESIKGDSRKQMRLLFDEFKKVNILIKFAIKNTFNLTFINLN